MLSEDNWLFSTASELIRGEQSSDEKSRIKALYIEGLIRFLRIYADSEIYEGIEINIPLVSLYVNSPEFENVDCYHIKSLEDIYQIIEMEILMGMPIWRFLKLSEYQLNLFEKNYEKVLKERIVYLRENYPCKRCIYFSELNTPLGYLSECNHRNFELFSRERCNSIDWTEITSCDKCIEVDTDVEYLKENSSYTYRKIISAQKELKSRLEKENTKSLDKYKITLSDITEANISISEETDNTSALLEDFGYALSNKRTKKERKIEIKKALLLEGFIEFINMYVQNEIGGNLCVDIYKVVLFIDTLDLDFYSKEQMFGILENMILDGFDILDFVKSED